MSDQAQRIPQEPQENKPHEFQPTEEIISSDAILDELNKATQKVEPQYWSCANGAFQHRHCGCEDGTDRSKPGGWGAGGSPGAPIYYSTCREDWHTPVPVRVVNGVIVGVMEVK